MQYSQLRLRGMAVPAAYVMPGVGNPATDFQGWYVSPNVTGLRVTRPSFPTPLPLHLPPDPPIAVLAAGSSAAGGVSSSRTMTQVTISHRIMQLLGPAGSQVVDILISSGLLDTCLQGFLDETGVPFETDNTNYRLIDGAYAENSGAATALARMQQDCYSSPTSLDCSGALSLIVLNHEWDSDDEWTAKALFSGFPDPYRFRLAHEIASPAPTVFRENYPLDSEFTVYRRAEAPHPHGTFWAGMLTTVDNAWYGVRAGSRVRVLLINMKWTQPSIPRTCPAPYFADEYAPAAAKEVTAVRPLIDAFMRGATKADIKPSEPTLYDQTGWLFFVVLAAQGFTGVLVSIILVVLYGWLTGREKFWRGPFFTGVVGAGDGGVATLGGMETFLLRFGMRSASPDLYFINKPSARLFDTAPARMPRVLAAAGFRGRSDDTFERPTPSYLEALNKRESEITRLLNVISKKEKEIAPESGRGVAAASPEYQELYSRLQAQHHEKAVVRLQTVFRLHGWKERSMRRKMVLTASTFGRFVLLGNRLDTQLRWYEASAMFAAAHSGKQRFKHHGMAAVVITVGFFSSLDQLIYNQWSLFGIDLVVRVRESTWAMTAGAIETDLEQTLESNALWVQSDSLLRFGTAMIDTLRYSSYAILVGLVAVGNVRGQTSLIFEVLSFGACVALLCFALFAQSGALNNPEVQRTSGLTRWIEYVMYYLSRVVIGVYILVCIYYTSELGSALWPRQKGLQLPRKFSRIRDLAHEFNIWRRHQTVRLGEFWRRCPVALFATFLTSSILQMSVAIILTLWSWRDLYPDQANRVQRLLLELEGQLKLIAETQATFQGQIDELQAQIFEGCDAQASAKQGVGGLLGWVLYYMPDAIKLIHPIMFACAVGLTMGAVVSIMLSVRGIMGTWKLYIHVLTCYSTMAIRPFDFPSDVRMQFG